VSTKAKAMGLLQAYASRGSWEPEARARAQNAAASVQASVRLPWIGRGARIAWSP
jgi:hypothetical protein